MTMAPTLRTYLDQRQVPYELVSHRHTATSLRSAGAAHVDPTRLAKAVLLERDVEDGRFAIAVLPATHRLRFGEAARQFGRKVQLATENDAARLFQDCEAGAIPALGPAYGLDTIVDDALLAQPPGVLRGRRPRAPRAHDHAGLPARTGRVLARAHRQAGVTATRGFAPQHG